MKLRTMVVSLLLISSVGMAQGNGNGNPHWPSVDEQLAKHGIGKGSALERLVRQNQDFDKLLRADELSQRPNIPPWLKVYWRKGHPEAQYSADDPTGGYPHVLNEVLEWMLTHQDLRPGNPEYDMLPGQEPRVGDPDDEEEGGRSPMGRLALAPVAGSNVRTSGSQSAARSESDIRVNPWNTQKVIAASNNIASGGFQGQYWSTDGGTTWGQTVLPNSQGDSFNSDPTVDWTSDGRAWSTTMGITGSTNKMYSYRSTDSGATWTYDGTFSGTQTNTDKQMMWVDHTATSPYKDQIYAIWHNGNPAFMNRRNASGWGSPIQVSSTETTGTGIGADVKANQFGDVFGSWPDTGSRGIYIVKSTNGGTGYGAPVRIVTTYDSYDIGVPSFNGRRILIYVSIGAYRTSSKNLVYASWTDLSGDANCTAAANEPGSSASSTCKTRVWFSRSTDGGATWSARAKVNNQAGLNDQFNQFLAVDESTGTVGLMYYDTVNDSTRKKTDVWYQSSTDDGATWSAATKVTTAQTDETISGADSGNQYGDYNGLSGAGGVFFPSWTDRRSGAREEIWTAKITDNGTTTYSIAGNAGTDGATVNAGATATTSDASGNYSLSGLAAGTYTVTPSKSGCTFSPTSLSVTVGPNATGKSFTATCASGDTQLTSGVTLNGQSVAFQTWKYYFINVPAGSTQLVFATTGATADVDIYTLAGSKPTLTTYTCRPYSSSGNETCTATNPAAGTWYLGVYGYAAGSYSVTATVTTPAPTYSIAGNAGTASASVSAGASSTTADASGNYSIGSLSAGTYTVTPSKSGCTFTPASQSVTVGPSATSVNFSASCSTPTYSIAGNAGTASASVSAGAASTTADASGNYSIGNLVAGTYTVTPSKSGCTFSPVSQSVTVGPSATGKNFTASCSGTQVERLSNGGFETITASTNAAPDGSWTRTAFTGTSFSTLFANGTARTGTDHAYLGVNGATSTQTLDHAALTIPSTATSATLSFWTSIVTSETTTTTAYDTLKIQVVDNTTGAVTTLATLSNLNKTTSASTYVQRSYSVTSFKGKSVTVRFLAATDVSLATTFRVDDVSLMSD